VRLFACQRRDKTPLRIAPDHARRFVRRALLLDAPVPDVATAVAHHEFTQIDSVNVCSRETDLTLAQRALSTHVGNANGQT
jgi:uncharacterized protein YcaQ